MAKALLGIDVGGGSVRAVIRDIEGGRTTFVKKSMTPKALFTIGDFGYGMDTQVIFSILAETVKACMAKGGYAPGDIIALSTSVLRHTLVALDADGEVLFASPNRDARAVDATMRLNDSCADEIYQLSGHRPMPNLTACKLLWLQETQPELYSRIKTAFTLQDYLNYRFTGKIFAERSNAGETMLYDLAASAWSDAMIAKLGLSRGMFPELIDAGRRIGSLNAAAAEALSLSESVAVVTGAGDTQSALLGMGAIENGDTAIVAGTTAPIQMVLDRPVIDAKSRLWTGVAGVPGKYVLESNAGGMGISLEWMAGLLFNESPSPVGALLAAASKADPGAGGMLSTVGAQIFNTAVLNLPIEQTVFSTTNYIPDAAADRNRAARAAIEGMAYALRGNVAQIEEVSGLSAGGLRLGGGMARSSVFAGVVGEVTGRAIAVPELADASAMGAVISAAVGAGVCANHGEAAARFAKLRAPIQPAGIHEVYERVYDEWLDLYQASSDNFTQFGMLINELRMDASGSASSGGEASASLRIYADADLSDEVVRLLGEFGEVTYSSYREGEMLEGDDMIRTLKDYDVFITEVDIVDAAIIKELPNLRMIGVCRGNPTNIDVEACSAAGIPVVYTPGRNAEAVADMTLAFILSIARMIPESAAYLKEEGAAGDMGRQGTAYFRYQGTELWRTSIGIVGGGAIGKKVAKRLLGFEAKLFVFDPYLSPEDAALMGAEKVELDELLAVSDIITLHAPVTPETTDMINAAAFEKMKDGVLLVNTARAAIMDYDALLAALQSGKVKGAALDVFPLEPPASDDPLVLLPNVLSTPHIAGNTRQVGIHQGLIMAENIKKLLAGELSTDVINRKAFQSFSFTGEKKFDTAALKQLEGKVVGVNDLDTGKSAAASVPEAKASIPAPVPAAASAPAGGGYMALIQGFLNNMAADTDVKAKTANKDISFQITFKDTEESCYMIFKKGDITVGLGECPDGAEVNLRMPVDCFDGMMMGTKKVMDIVSSGALSFTGNIRKAMTMQPMLKMMMGSYQAAVAKTGFRLEDAGSPAAVSAPSGIGYLGLINEFLGIMAADTDVKAKTANKDISFQITFKDTEESCYMIFKKGDITVGLGECPDGAEVNLRMPIDCFDGMMMGTMKVMDIVSSGALSFTGNIRKAMSMQPMLKMMMGSYQAAVAKTGFRMADLGAVGAADKAAPAAPAQAPAQPQAQAAPAAVPQQEAPAKPGFFGKRKLFGGKQQAQPVVQQVIMEAGKPKTGDVRDEILQITTEMYAKGLITGIGGNISARCDDNPDHIWITPSSIFKGDLRADQMVRLDMNGKAVGGAELSASSEKNVHLAIYQRRPEISAVIHSHATKSTLMGLAGLKFAPISSDAAFFGDVPVVPFIIPGSPELGDLVGEAVGEEGAAVIMQNHGLVVAGTNLRRASDMTDCIETTATKILEAKAMGIELSQIPPADVEELAALGKMLV